MANYDDLFDQPQGAPAAFDKGAWAANKQAQREAVYDLAEQTTLGLSDPAVFRQYLDVQGQFPLYSANNALLIAAQMPQATQLRDFNAWQEKGASIQKGAKGIQILEPGKKYERDDGGEGTSMNVKFVFDVSQTDAGAYTPSAYNDTQLLRALINKASVLCIKAQEGQLPEGIVAQYDGKAILVRQGSDPKDMFRAIATEMAGVNREPFQARCAAYILCRRYGVEPPAVDRSLETARTGDAKLTRAELGKIRDAADTIGKRMYRNLEPRKTEPRS